MDVERFNVRFHEPQEILDTHLQCPRSSVAFWVLFWAYSNFLRLRFIGPKILILVHINRNRENGGKNASAEK